MRNDINDKLLEIDSNVYYGLAPDISNIDEWDYFVFGQDKLRKSGTSSNDLNGYWYVTIVRENYIPDSVVFEVIEKLTEIAGLRLADDEFEYNYLFKGETNLVVELLTLKFTKTKKKEIENA